MTRVVPVILAGGGGSRLWPISTVAAPKQLLDLVTDRTLLQETALRVAVDTDARFTRPMIVTGAALAGQTLLQMRGVGIEPDCVVLEPEGRNTAPAIAVAGRVAAELHPGALMLVLASDHHVARPDALRDAVFAGVPAAEEGALVTLGIVPTRPETGYGYIERGEGSPPCYPAKRFLEKPDLKTAEAFVADGGYYWNASIFLFSPQALKRALERHAPDVDRAAGAALDSARRSSGIIRLGAEFAAAPSISIDYAVMEKAADVRVVPADMGWSDVGSLATLHEVSAPDAAGNSVRGAVIAEDAAGCYLRADRGVVAAIGVRDLAVVQSGNAVLVAALDRAQDVRKVHDRVARLSGPPAAEGPSLTESMPEARALHRWLVEDALPVFLKTAWDTPRGGFYERFDAEGWPDTALDYKRLRVQARQIFVGCAGHRLGLEGEYLDRAMEGFVLLRKRAWQETGGWPHLLTPEGTAKDTTRDTYDHAFVLFALAALFRATGEREVLDWANRTTAYLDATMTDFGSAGYAEGAPPSLPRRANPHMHLLEAFLALFDATGDFGWLARARDMVNLFAEVFFDPQTGSVREYFDADWSPSGGRQGRLREPGHHWEWAYLLFEYERRAGADFSAEIDALTGFALAHGHSARTGLAWDEILEDGSVVRASHRLWPQTEAVRGLSMLLRRGRHDVADRLARLCGSIDRYHLARAPDGMWIDRVDADGRPLGEHIPASTLYHLVTGILALAP